MITTVAVIVGEVVANVVPFGRTEIMIIITQAWNMLETINMDNVDMSIDLAVAGLMRSL